MNELRVILADDHQMFRQALRTKLESEPGIAVVGEASNGDELLKIAATTPFDIACIDIAMPYMNGVEATRRLLAKYPGAKVIGLSAFHDRDFVVDLMKAGASGYVTKNEAVGELLRAIQAVRNNRTYLCSDVSGTITEALIWNPEDPAGSVRLGSRERQVLQLVSEGLTSSKIAQRLNISASTVEVHRRNIMRKLDLHSVAEITKFAIRNGLTTA